MVGFNTFLKKDSNPLQDGSARKQPFPIDVQLESVREIKLVDFFNGFLFKICW